MNLLARREHTTHELLVKLQLKEFPKIEIQQEIAKLLTENLISHTRFLENYIHYRRGKGFGPVRIRSELIERGIEEELIDHHLDITDNAWLIEARDAWRKRFKNSMPENFKAQAKQMRFLQYRGFTQEQIKAVISADTSRVC